MEKRLDILEISTFYTSVSDNSKNEKRTRKYVDCQASCTVAAQLNP